VLAELDDTVRAMTADLDRFDTTHSGARLDRFVDDLSNWYVRRSRRRFWRSGCDADTQAAFLTLWECLTTVAKLTAPFTPFIADAIFTNLTGPDAESPDSVHLADWPEPDDARRNDGLRARMGLVRRLVTLGRSARTDAKVRVRQPLRRALVVLPSSQRVLLEGLEDLVAEELNVKEVEVAHGLEELVSYVVKPNFRVLGPRFGAQVKKVAQALERADPAHIVGSLEEHGTVAIDVDGMKEELGRDEVDVRVSGRSGLSFAQDGPCGLALDLAITPELFAEGVARETVRSIQELRKSSGLAVEDRIELWLTADDEPIVTALRDHNGYIAAEVLATALHIEEGPPPAAAASSDASLDDKTLHLALEKSG
jgi:isoleucyl-tRNA synthetase